MVPYGLSNNRIKQSAMFFAGLSLQHKNAPSYICFCSFPTSFLLCCSLRTGLFNKTLACIVCLSLSFLGKWTVDSRIMRYTSLKCFYHNGEMDTHTHTHTHTHTYIQRCTPVAWNHCRASA